MKYLQFTTTPLPRPHLLVETATAVAVSLILLLASATFLTRLTAVPLIVLGSYVAEKIGGTGADRQVRAGSLALPALTT